MNLISFLLTISPGQESGPALTLDRFTQQRRLFYSGRDNRKESLLSCTKLYGDDHLKQTALTTALRNYKFSEEKCENSWQNICIILSLKIKSSKATSYKEKVLTEISRKCRKYMVQRHTQELCKVRRYLLKSLLFHCGRSGLLILWPQFLGEENKDSETTHWFQPPQQPKEESQKLNFSGYSRSYVIFIHSFAVIFPCTVCMWNPYRDIMWDEEKEKK